MLLEAPLYLAIGAVAGFASGLLGIGGGVLIVPAMVAMASVGTADPGHVLKAAVATSSLVVFANSLSAYFGHRRRGAVDFAWVRGLGLWCALGAMAGALLTVAVDRDWALCAVVSIELIAAFSVFRSTLPGHAVATATHAALPRRSVARTAGVMIGLASASAGIAGGTLLTPLMTLRGLPINRAAGTATALGMAIGGGAALTFLVLPSLRPVAGGAAYVNLSAATLMIVGGMLAARAGVVAAHAWPKVLLKRLLSGVLLLSAVCLTLQALQPG